MLDNNINSNLVQNIEVGKPIIIMDLNPCLLGVSRRIRPSVHRGYNRRYHKVWPTSHVDESLFGPAHRERRTDNSDTCYTYRTPDELAEAKWKSKTRWGNSNVKTSCPSTTRESINVPRLDPSQGSVVLGPNDYYRLVDAAKFISLEERQEMRRRATERQLQKADAVDRGKNAVKERDLMRKSNRKLTDLEEEEKLRHNAIVERANAVRDENEDEIKELNVELHNAKVQMVRDAQLLEKEQIAEAKKAEEMRLDALMEEDRINRIRMQEEIELRRHEECLIGAKAIIDQIERHQEDKLINIEMKDREHQSMKKLVERLCETEQELAGRRDEDKQKLRKELDSCLADVNIRKAIEAEERKTLAKNVQAWQNAKAEREVELEAKKARIRRERELEIEKVRRMQAAAGDRIAVQNEMQAKRDKEAEDRRWRKKEAAEAAKAVAVKKMMRDALARQRDQKTKLEALELQRGRHYMALQLKTQIEELEKEKAEREARRLKTKEFCKGLIQQIEERETMTVEERKEGIKQRLEREQQLKERQAHLEAMKNLKLNELRALGIPEKYCGVVSKKTRFDRLEPLQSKCNIIPGHHPPHRK